MTKHSRKRSRSFKNRSMRRYQAQYGGNLAGNPPSAWGWVLGTVGAGPVQAANSLTVQPGQNLGTIQSNNIVPIGNLNAQDSQGMIGTNLKGDIPQSGGKRRRGRGRGRTCANRGGNVIAQAVVPATLMAISYGVGRRRKKTHRHKYR
jgi:hypothetical protein